MKKRMMWKRGRKSGNVSGLLKMKVITPFTIKFDYSGGAKLAQWSKNDANLAHALLGDGQENYYTYQRLQDYSTFCVERISTRIQNFQLHRRVETTYQQGENWGWFEDKVTYTDPIVYFYREKYGRGLPGAFNAGASNHAFMEISKEKCIQNCRDGWYWTTEFKTKNERKMVDTEILRKMIDRTTPLTGMTKNQLLEKLGVEPKNDAGTYDDLHNCEFVLGRGPQYAKEWYDGKQSHSVSTVNRYVTDFLNYDLVTWITVRCFRHKV